MTAIKIKSLTRMITKLKKLMAVEIFCRFGLKFKPLML